MPKEQKFETKTNTKSKSVVDAKLKPTSELHLLVGGPYGKHIYGHAAIRIVIPNKSDLTYDFGRYGKIYSEDIGMGIVLRGGDSPRGEGILNIWSSFNAYIGSENRTGRVTRGYKYFIFENQAQAANDHFKTMIKGKEPIKIIIKGKERKVPFKRYKLATDYFALGPNCTTLSLDAAKKAIPNIDKGSEEFIDPGEVLDWKTIAAMKIKYGSPKRIFLPANLRKYLDSGSKVSIDEKNTYGGGK